MAAEGVLTSAVPELPPSEGIITPTTLSLVEGASLGLPAGISANTEVQLLRSVAEATPLRQHRMEFIQNCMHGCHRDEKRLHWPGQVESSRSDDI